MLASLLFFPLDARIPYTIVMIASCLLPSLCHTCISLHPPFLCETLLRFLCLCLYFTLFLGPAAYNTRDTTRRADQSGPAYSIAGRPSDAKHDNVPGPGAYDSNKHAAVGSSGPSAVITSRHNLEPDDEVPGPGAYDQEYGRLAKERKGFTIAGRHEVEVDDSTPGKALLFFFPPSLFIR